VKPCPNKLDPLDVEALASGAGPFQDAGAEAHAEACPSCAALVQEARRVAEDLAALAPVPEPPLDLAKRVLRLRPFSRRERLSLRIWAPPAALSAAVFCAGLTMLAAPGLSGREQVGLGASALLPLVGVLRALTRWAGEVVRFAPAGLESLSAALRQEQALGIAAAVLFVPVAFGLRRVLARARK
jgi:hypothetical protein